MAFVAVFVLVTGAFAAQAFHNYYIGGNTTRNTNETFTQVVKDTFTMKGYGGTSFPIYKLTFSPPIWNVKMYGLNPTTDSGYAKVWLPYKAFRSVNDSATRVNNAITFCALTDGDTLWIYGMPVSEIWYKGVKGGDADSTLKVMLEGFRK